MGQAEARVLAQRQVAQEMYLLELECPPVATLGRPGQFLMVDCPGEGDFLRRPLALHGIHPSEGRLSLLYTVVGQGTAALARLRLGEGLGVLGPMGQPLRIPPAARELVLVAGGIGIASLTALAEEAVEQGLRVTLLHGARTALRMYPASLLPPAVREMTATDDGSAGHRGLVTHLLRQVEAQTDWIVACGPTPMLRALARMQQEGVVTKPITALLELRMGCGFGACYGCTVITRDGPRLVCKDGPALPLEAIAWEGPIVPAVH